MTEVQAGGRRLRLSNLDKVLYPRAGFTKAQVIDYYARVAPVLLPHLRDRPLTLKRYPEGVDGEYFYEKNAPAHRPAWVRTAPVWSEHGERTVRYCLASDLATLVWIANLACLELHPSLSRVPALDRPSLLVFDLDPGPPADLVACGAVARLVRAALAHDGLDCLPKVSGSKGLQVYCALDGRADYDATKRYAHDLALRLEREHPALIVSNMKKAERTGRVLVDWSQNDEHKTTVSVYSLRARERPTVSMPVTWVEVDRLVKSGDPTSLVFEAPQALARLDRRGDLFEPLLRSPHRLPG